MADSNNEVYWCCGMLIVGYVIVRIIVDNIATIVWGAVVLGALVLFYYIAKNMDSKKSTIDTSQPPITDSPDSDKQIVYQGIVTKLPGKINDFLDTIKSIGDYDDDVVDDDVVDDTSRAAKSHLDVLNQLVVKVISADNAEPIKDCIVKVKSDAVSLEKISDIDGKTIFSKLGVGNYKISITAEGFRIDEQDVHINEMKKLVIKLNRSATLKITLVDTILKTVIKGASIKIKGDKYNTSENGSVCINDLVCGNKIAMDITVDQYFPHRTEHTMESNEDTLTIELKSNIELDGKYIDFRNELEAGIANTFNKLPPSIDILLPNYYKEMFMSLINVTESIATNPIYRQLSDYDEKMDQLHKTLRNVYVEIDAMLTNNHLIDTFIETSLNDDAKLPDIGINNDSYNSYIKLYMDDPNNLVGKYKDKIEKQLYEVDRDITEKDGIYKILPIASLWTVTKKFVTGTADNAIENSARLLFGKMLLDSTGKMFEIEEIKKRLQR